jgi:hypothetical protein
VQAPSRNAENKSTKPKAKNTLLMLSILF